MITKKLGWNTFMFVLILILSQALPNSAAQVWSEDFEGNLDDWTLEGYYWDANYTWWQTTHDLKIVDGALTAPQSTTFNDTQIAYHDSAVEYGTWSFDWTLGDGNVGYDAFVFMMNDETDLYNFSGINEADFRFEGYGLLMDFFQVGVVPELRLIEYYGVDSNKFADAHVVEKLEPTTRDQGSFHFDITRNEDGKIRIYMDDELMIEFTDKSTPQSERIQYVSWTGNTAIDNIVVDDQVKDPSKDDAPLLILPFALTFAMIVFIKKKRSWVKMYTL
ncbi:MAG: hypothetical protein ACXAD7_26160 [Candidatus Kariarchaeaceae archaeon]|jgi:hypothetical protein